MPRFRTQPLLIGALVASFAAGLSSTSCSGQDESEEPTLKNVRKIVYAVRQHTWRDGDGKVQINVAGGMGQVMDYLRYVPGGRLEVYDLETRKAQNIIAGFKDADVSSLDVSHDGTKVVFSMKQNRNDNYHIYWAGLESKGGKFEIHQLTFGPHDDLHPVVLAGGKIAFVTNEGYTEMGTRADEYNHSKVVTQIATITETGGDADRKLCSQNLSHTINLFALADGRVGFSRWEHLENVNDVKLFAMNPDCTQMVAIGGQHGKLTNSLIQVNETGTPNVFLAIGTSRENTIQAGALLRIDARAPHDPKLAYEEEPEFENLTPSVPLGRAPSPIGRYRSPVSLPDGSILVSWSGDATTNEADELALSPPDFGLYIYDPATRVNQLVVNYEDSWELYAKPVVKRAEPPIISSVQENADPGVPTVLGSIDVRNTSLFAVHGEKVSGAQFDKTAMDEALKQTDRVRILEGFSSEASPGTTMFGLTMAEGAAILGEAEVYEDGSWLAAIPPYVPVHLQAIDEFDLAIRNQTLWIQGMPGESRVCGGCHESRTETFDPGGQALTIAAGKGPQNFNLPVAQREELPWYKANAGFEANEIQAILNNRCVSCHNETTNGSGAQEFYEITMTDEVSGQATTYQIPRMDLSDRPITVTYDNKVDTYPASYVSIFYPSALSMEMDQTTVVGTIPPIWGRPSDARGSALIEKLNIWSRHDQKKNAWKLGEAFSDPAIKGGSRALHPENVGGTLTREERQKLIRAIDAGGQYYARQNTAFKPYGNNPLGGGSKY